MKARVLTITASFLLLTFMASAQGRGRNSQTATKTVTVVSTGNNTTEYSSRSRNYRTVAGPRYTTTTTVIKHVPVHYGHNTNYVFHDNHFCTYTRTGYVHVIPPIGLQINVLPTYSNRFRVGNRTYFVHDGVYFRYRRNLNVYEVVARPRGQYRYF